jgi:hypothetical protein
MSRIRLVEQTTIPDTPGANEVILYVDTNSVLCTRNDAGTRRPFGDQGSWTPVLKFATTTVTGVTIGSATYAIVGPMCFVQCYLTLTGKNGTGHVQIHGLPVPANSTTNAFWTTSGVYYTALTSSVTGLTGFVRPGTSQIEMYKNTTATDVAELLDSDMSTTTSLILSATYRAA